MKKTEQVDLILKYSSNRKSPERLKYLPTEDALLKKIVDDDLKWYNKELSFQDIIEILWQCNRPDLVKPILKKYRLEICKKGMYATHSHIWKYFIVPNLDDESLNDNNEK